MTQWDDSFKKKAYGITLHGDEGQGKRGRNVMIISWSPLAITKETMYSKFPYCDPGLLSLPLALCFLIHRGFQIST